VDCCPGICIFLLLARAHVGCPRQDVDYKELEEKLPFATALAALVAQNANMGAKVREWHHLGLAD
jgi:hypothetical protein